MLVEPCEGEAARWAARWACPPTPTVLRTGSGCGRPLNAMSTRSFPASRIAVVRLAAMGGRKRAPSVPWTQWLGNGPPSDANEVWSCGW